MDLYIHGWILPIFLNGLALILVFVSALWKAWEILLK